MKKPDRIYAYSALALLMIQTVVVLVSWILTAISPAIPMRSLLSSEGVRWFFGEFVSNLASPLLVWLLLLCLAYNAFRTSGLMAAFACGRHLHGNSFRHRFAFKTVIVEIILYICVILSLTCVPHAVLLSSTGHLFPSSFSESLVPIIAFGMIMASVTYGLLSKTLLSLVDVFHSLTKGGAFLLPWCLIYVLGVQLFYSLKFVFCF